MSFDPAPFHPIVVHFAIALLATGVALRLLSLVGWLAFVSPAARILLLAGALAALAAIESGQAAVDTAENIPGAHDAVEEHEAWGKRTRTVFLVVAGIELVGLVLGRWGKERPALLASSVVGLLGLIGVYETGEHGGRVVYSYAGGVGTRSGDPADVGRLLLAGLYHQAQADRDAGRGEDAARLVDEAARRWPGSLDVQLLSARSRLVDRKDPAGALEILSRAAIPKEARRLRRRHGLLLAEALLAAGQQDAARAALQALQSEFPNDTSITDRIREAGQRREPAPAPSPGPAAPSPAPEPSPAASPTPSTTPEAPPGTLPGAATSPPP